MQLRMWTYDLAREQCPTLEHLRHICQTSLDAGYNALGLYMEHRYAYPSTPWAHGIGSLTPETAKTLHEEFPHLQIIPFINVLGHMEGFLYTEAGHTYAEERFKGLQACPSKAETKALAEKLIDDILKAFPSQIIHIGGDEAKQLGNCDQCSQSIDPDDISSGKAKLYSEYMLPLIQKVIDAGRRPAIWGDMLLEHKAAAKDLPRETLIFDWHYWEGPKESASWFQSEGFEVVCCPTIHTFNAVWMHLPESEENVRQHVIAAKELNAHGVCVTTWECALMGAYDTLFPALKAAAKVINGEDDQEGCFLRAYKEESDAYEEWAKLIGVELPKVGGVFAFSHTRSSLKTRFLLMSNPFLAWCFHANQLCGNEGEVALRLAKHAIEIAPNAATRGVATYIKSAIEFVRYAEQARVAYANELPGVAISALSPARQVIEDVERFAKATHLRIGGSLADIERCRIAREHVERVILRIKAHGDSNLGYLPSFEHITHQNFVPHDQGAWWRINDWARL